MAIQRRTSWFLALALLASSCKGADTEVASPASSSASSAAVQRPATYCSFTSTTNPCPGMLAADFLNNDPKGALKKARKTFDQKNGTGRTVDCEGPCNGRTQYATPFVNRHAREIDLAQLPPRLLILLGGVRFSGNGPKDAYYQIGDNLVDVEDARMLYLVANAPTRPAPTRPYRTAIAEWTIYKVFVNGTVEAVKTGTIYRCVNDHGGLNPSIAYAKFQTCEPDMLAAPLAQATGVSIVDLLDHNDCEPGAVDCEAHRKSKLNGMAQYLSVNAPAGLFSAPPYAGKDRAQVITMIIDRLDAVRSNPLSDPYWFTCALGCCTAETDV